MNGTYASPLSTILSCLEALKHKDLYSAGFLIVGAGIALPMIRRLFFGAPEKGGIPHKSGLLVIGSWRFFTSRHQFSHEGLNELGNVFSFNVLHHNVMMVSGEDARRVFFGNKDLDNTEAYQVLFGGADPDDITVERDEYDTRDMTAFSRRFLTVFRKDRLAKTLTSMLHDIEQKSVTWGQSGQFDPFDDIYNVIVQLTVRALSCREVADNTATVKRVVELYWEVEKGNTPAVLLLPWLPNAARNRKKKATTDLFILFKDCLDKRIEEGREENDPAQYLLDDGNSVDEVAQFIIGSLFAGILNTAIMTSWLVLYLGSNAEWRNKVLRQSRAFVAKYATQHSFDGGQPVSLVNQLAQLGPHVWDEEMSELDLCLRETMRIVMTGSAVRLVKPGRKNEGVEFKGQKVKPGTFLAHSMTSVHLDPAIYPDPLRWDPSRFERGEDKKEYWAFAGWGVGRHPCLGMRFAKIEVKTLITLFLMQYEYDLVDAAGKSVTELPEPNRQDMYRCTPNNPVYVKYRRVQE